MKMKHLTSLGVTWDYLNNDHVIEIINSNQKLTSVSFKTQQDIDKACCYMIKTIKQLKELELNVPIISSM